MSIHHEHAQDILDTHIAALSNNAQLAYAKMGALAVPATGPFGRATGTADVKASRQMSRQMLQDIMVQALRQSIMAATDALIAIQDSASEPV